ncbi:hypothetical protein LY90DRAFT_499819 [Neocallimastix californiae]|uniref:DRBM domain-containing protein n=1 Tax=Neocallimastix californiae TaxID=1754190 RepID=A0A1Y2FJ67_9FUNG|nr:hypothetical protein LY90DRAFT_499819 [Neocallimastix californiae]|eukprot:ORY82855.1 hypothetical protein LY90DRAFT_499819 [Neocallimastix californiae]
MTDKNAIAQLYEYCQNKNTTISISDLDFSFEINQQGNFNCKVTLHDKVYDKNLSCRSKREAKNKIAEFVLEDLIKKDKDDSIFDEKVKEQLELKHISLEDDLIIDIYECEADKYICIVKFKSLNDKVFCILEPELKSEINDKFLKFLNNSDDSKEESLIDESEFSLVDYSQKYDIPYSYEIIFEKNNVKCKYYSLGIVIGEKGLKLNEGKNNLEEEVRAKAGKEALDTIKEFIDTEDPIFPLYKNKIIIYINKEKLNIDILLNKEISEEDSKYNTYMQSVTQNFISTNSKKEEKQYLNKINNIITNIMNKVKKDKKINGTYLIKKINNYEIWNLINYEIIIYVEFKIEYIHQCMEEIYIDLQTKFEDSILEMEKEEEILNKNEKVQKPSNKIRIRLNNGSTFCIYIGSSIYEEMLTKYISPFKACLDMEKKYIQFVILWSNLVLYQNFNKTPKEGYVYYLKEQERIFTILALYSWDYTSNYLKKADKNMKKNLYILSFKVLLYMVINYETLNATWIELNDIKKPLLMDPISDTNLITSRNKFIWDNYKMYCSKIYDNLTKRVQLLLDENEPIIEYPDSFNSIKKVFVKINIDPEITIKTSLYHIPKKSKHKEILNVVFNSLQSFLLLNIYNTENSLKIQNLNNDKNEEEFDSLNRKMKKSLYRGIETYFKILNKIPVEKIKDISEFSNGDINKLFFILGNNANASINIVNGKDKNGNYPLLGVIKKSNVKMVKLACTNHIVF